MPDALIPQAGTRYRQRTVVELAAGATFVSAETIAPGRRAHGERFAYDLLELTTEVRRDGRELCVETLRLEPGRARPDVAGVLGGADYLVSLLALAPESDAARLAATIDAALAAGEGFRGAAGELPRGAGAAGAHPRAGCAQRRACAALRLGGRAPGAAGPAAAGEAQVTVHVTGALGRLDEPRFDGRRVVEVPIAWDEASRRRLRRAAADGTDVAIDLASGDYLADGAVLFDDGETVLAIARRSEPALLVRLDAGLTPERLLEQAIRLGHAFGNQHVPVDVEDGVVRVPLTTSEAIARATVEALELDGAVVEVADVALGRLAPLSVGHAHRHGDEG